jgi:hypothetical protein
MCAKSRQEVGLQNTSGRDARPKDPYLQAVGIAERGGQPRPSLSDIRYFWDTCSLLGRRNDSIKDVLHGCDVKEGVYFASKPGRHAAWYLV